ncbi:MAG: TonB-dependent receptor [Paucibacter sp.]|nr:TonB-dependent receptor [Roseateles sp.]
MNANLANPCRAQQLLPLAFLLHAAASWAQNTPAEPSKTEAQALPTVKLQGRQQRSSELAGPTTQLSGDELRNKASATLGATLQDELGVANSSFGPNVGLPIIRGQGGSRVKALVGGGGAHDASTHGADHGVMVEAGLAQSITVHRGPSAIRHGGDAIGGAVEIEYGRIPEQRPVGLKLQSEGRAGGGGTLGLLRAQGGWGGSATPDGDEGARPRNGWAWHLDAHGRRKDEARIPGWAIDEEAVKQQFFLVSRRNTWGHIPNSDARSSGGAAGLSSVFDAGYAGASAATMRINYGLPPGAHSHNHGGGSSPPGEPAEPAIRIQAEQQRLDLKSAIKLGGAWARELKLHLADTRYRHDELNQGVSETEFRNEVQEGRLELEHSLAPAHWGSLGLHLQNRRFSALGLEAFVPRTRIDSAALYAIQGLKQENWTLELGLRADWRRSRPQPQASSFGIEVQLPERRFTFGNLSLALTRQLGDGSVSLTHWRASRAPDVQELYALGPHIATRTYDFGNSALRLETLRGWNLALRQQWGSLGFQANAFRYDSEDHIYQRSMGVFYAAEKKQFRALCAQLDQCLPVTRYEQEHARFRGFEAELKQELLDLGAEGAAGDSLQLSLLGDRLRGRLDRLGQDVPRQPAPRWGVRLELLRGPWQAELRRMHSLAQRHPGENETDTAASTQWHASLRWSGRLDSGLQLSTYVLGRNLSNQEVRNSTSFLRNYAPEPGRSIELGAELRY